MINKIILILISWVAFAFLSAIIVSFFSKVFNRFKNKKLYETTHIGDKFYLEKDNNPFDSYRVDIMITNKKISKEGIGYVEYKYDDEEKYRGSMEIISFYKIYKKVEKIL